MPGSNSNTPKFGAEIAMPSITERLDSVASQLESFGLKKQAAELDTVSNSLDLAKSASSLGAKNDEAARKIIMKGDLAGIVKNLRDIASAHGEKSAFDAILMDIVHGKRVDSPEIKNKVQVLAQNLDQVHTTEKSAGLDALINALPINALGLGGSILAVLTALGHVVSTGGSGKAQEHVNSANDIESFIKDRMYGVHSMPEHREEYENGGRAHKDFLDRNRQRSEEIIRNISNTKPLDVPF